jgi:hypothetical protein
MGYGIAVAGLLISIGLIIGLTNIAEAIKARK